MQHRCYTILFTLLMACLSVMGQVRDIVIKDGAYYTTAGLAVDTIHNQSFEKDSIYLIVPRDVQIAYPDYNNRAQLIIWQSGRPIYALPITQYDSLSYVRMLQGDTLRTIFSQQAGSLPIYGKRPIVWQHGQVTITDSAQVLTNDIYQSIAQGNYANFIIQPTEIVRDTQYILCIRDTVYKVQDIYDDTDDVDSIPSVDTIPPTPGRRIGVFSVAADKQVSFSQGNLQYVQSTNTWHFASEQYEYIGADNIQNSALADKIDLFGWSANNTTAPFGVSMSTNNADYAGEFVDWGTNIIQGDATNTWRTLSKEEWEYLIKGRKNASNLRAAAQVNGVNGMILLPDDWECPEGIDFKAGYHTSKGSEYYAEYQQFTKEQWRELETTGAIFLPAAGMHDGNGIADIQAGGYYWSATDNGDTYAYTLISQSSGAYLTYDNRYDVRSVRLVHDTIVPPPAPCETFKVNGVTFNMMCVEGGTFMMGATEEDSTANKNEFPQHQVTLSDYMVLQTEVTKEQWLAVMGTKPQGANSTWGTGDVTTPANYVTWSECVDFTHRLSQLTGQNFRLLTEAEWEFAARGGNKSRGYRYSGSDNLDEVGWYIQNRQSTTHPVAQKRPNELGIYDMSGNVWEWCLDSPQDYKDYAQVNPLGAFVNHRRVIRGGAYEREEYRCTNTHRTTWLSAWSNKGANTGFRVVLNNNHVVHTLLLNDTVAFNMKFVEGEMYDYKIAQTEVTQGLWEQVMGYNNSLFKGEYLPVEKVSWEECQTFIQKLNEMTGKHFRLPTEAEWEYAARGGKNSRGYTYAGSNSIDSVAWYQSNSQEQTHTIATLMPNELGIYDMSGNVWEWCQDYYDASTQRVVRGGSFYDVASVCRISSRGGRDANYRSYIGLRLVLDEHEYVDLGLSVMWATTNVGAESAEEYGDYFAWGETEPKDEYSWTNYEWCDGTANNMTKYNATDGLKTLLPEDDAAHVNWGGEWRMPTGREMQELYDYCIWERINTGEHKGYRLISKINGNSIFLPAAGFKSGLSYNAKDSGNDIWSSSIATSASAKCINFINSDSEYRHLYTSFPRNMGFSVRPVLPTDRELLPPLSPAKRIGIFSVAKDKQVSFSQGNLQYIQSANLWRFAENQYDYIGEENVKDGELANRIDLFGWSGNNTTALFGVSTSTNNADYAGEFFDWGVNTISDDAPNTWRTLSIAEWEYLLEKRPNAANLQGIAQVNGVNGLIILPDDWVCPLGIHFVHGFHSDFGIDYFAQHQQFTLDQWIILEQSGAVFLPASKWRNGSTFTNSSEGGHYWSSTCGEISTNAHYLSFGSQEAWMNSNSLHRCFAVRLVHDTIVPQTIPDPCLVVKVNDTLSINMMCVEGGTFRMGAMEGDTQANANEKPAHEVTLSDYYIAQTELTQEVWEAVMGTTVLDEIAAGSSETTLGHGKNYPMYAVSYNDCKRFIAKLNQITHLTFSLPTEAEWEHAARGGQLSKGYLYAGSNNPDEVARHSQNPDNTKVYPVATLRPNELGIYDMAGNIWEWVEDGRRTYTSEAQVNPIGPKVTTIANMRGGSSYYELTSCRVSDRGREQNVDYKRTRMGIRLVLHDTVPVSPEPEYVDLGLSVKWATFNVGASKPEDYGDYFAWGETEPKEVYDWSTYKWCDGTENNITKYNATDGLTTLLPEDDAATMHWGGKWRMPTKKEIEELIDNCTWSESIRNGVKGYKVTSKHTGNSIFFPYSGYFNHDNSATLQGEKTLFYTWSSEHSDNTRAYDIHNRTGAILLEQNTRRCGFPIRPVYDDTPPAPAKRIGVFSVAPDKQVSFSQGNLQYTQSTDEWRFAREQYDYIGKGNITNGQLGQIIDMFGWSADADPANKWGVTIAKEGFDGDFVDWGLNYIHGEAPGSWRTLSPDEWSYLISCRQHATELWGVAQVAGVNGVIILPDRWSPTDELPFVVGLNKNGFAEQQTLSAEQWQRMEELGAVFYLLREDAMVRR